MDILRAVIFSIPKSVVGTGVTAAILIMFFGALRQSEVAPITVKQFNPAIHSTRADVTLTDTSLSMKIKWAKNMQKNGQFRKSTWLPARTLLYAQSKHYRLTTTTPPQPHLHTPLLCTRVPSPHTSVCDKICMGHGPNSGEGQQNSLQSAQPQKGHCHRGVHGGMW